jgi:hypothetical protein
MPKLDSYDRIINLVDRFIPRIKNVFKNAVARVKRSLDLKAIERLLVEGNIDDALAFISTIPAATATAVSISFNRSGEDTAELIADVTKTPVEYDNTNPRATEKMRNNRLSMVREFTAEQVSSTRQAIVRGIQRGDNPRVQALAFRDSIGLTAKQEQAVENYRVLLTKNSKQALDRQLRDKRFDSTVNRAIANDEPLSKQQIDRMVDRYRERYITYRSEVIARTESLRAVHEGVDEMYLQAFDEGVLDPNEMEKEWVPARDSRVRDSHRSMRGQKQPEGEAFISGDGNRLMYPGDPSAPASDSIQCRCAVVHNFKQ